MKFNLSIEVSSQEYFAHSEIGRRIPKYVFICSEVMCMGKYDKINSLGIRAINISIFPAPGQKAIKVLSC